MRKLLVSVCVTLAALAPATADAVGPAGGCTTASAVHAWSLRRTAAQVVVVPVEEDDVGAVADEVARGAGGVILFGSSAPADLGDRLARLLAQAPGGIAPVVMTDEEGGAVQRMADLVGDLPSARAMARDLTPVQVRRLAGRVGARMRDAHVTMDLAPVLDLDDRPGPSATNPDGTRSFGIDPRVARTYGLAFARGMRSAGVVPVVKHFPGLGHATTNPDDAPAWTLPWSVLRAQGLRPFRAAVAAGLPAVMVTTARVPGLSRLPATLSRRVITGQLRHRLGFHGLVMTDSLSAGAVAAAGYSVPTAAALAVEAGADQLLFDAPAGHQGRTMRRVVRSLVGAVRDGALPRSRLERAAVHVLDAKGAPVCR
jgi:beta-N-acetylhexosaminidase